LGVIEAFEDKPKHNIEEIMFALPE